MSVPTNGSGTRASTEIDVVETFLAALEALDIDAAVALLHDDIVYQNVPMPPARGIDAVRKQLGVLGRYSSGFQAITHNIAANGPVVLTERTDVIEIGRFQPAFWVCGSFEVRDGKIALWRDYFDYADVAVSMVKAAVRALRRRG
jgi:limonene-1,2-epoxide hydrolase